MKIDWDIPAPRSGFGGIVDSFIGAGAAKAEKAIQLYPPFLFAAGVVGVGLRAGFDWSVWQYVIIALIAVDMMGGVITNATSAAKR